MRIPVTLLLLATALATASAQQRLTVAQLQDLILNSRHQSEDSIAAQITAIQLTERMSAATLARHQLHFKGQRARLALQAIADASAFYDLPASELPAAPPPDSATQAAILNRARDYVRSLRPRLPNFSALRTTTLFESALPAQMATEERAYQLQALTSERLGYHSLGPAGPRGADLYLVGVTENRVAYNNGGEVQSPVTASRKNSRIMPGALATSGEFGPILNIVDQDTAHGTIAWHNWEQGSTGLLAVYRFAVPKEHSHFAVYSSDPRFPGFPPEEDLPAYHGEIAVDPADGSIYRIQILSDPVSDPPTEPSGVVVEYSQVEIGAKTYVCPLHAIAVSSTQDTGGVQGVVGLPPLRRFVNDVSFTQYHLFRSEYRIIP